jgi:hypothetical protein
MIDGERGSAEPDVLPAPGARLMPSTRRQRQFEKLGSAADSSRRSVTNWARLCHRPS